MRVALLSNTIDARDGYGNITFELTQALVHLGVDVILYLPRNQETLAASLSLGFPTACVLPRYIYRVYEPAGWRYFRPLRLSSVDLIHDLFAFPYCITAALSAIRWRKPLIMGAQGTHGVRPLTYWPEGPLLRWCYGKAAAIAVPSAYTKRMILEHARRDYAIDIIHDGVRFTRFQATTDVAAIRRRYAGKRILLTVGGLWGRKGHDLVIRALPRVREKHRDFVYVMVGEGNAHEQLERLAEGCGVRDIIDFAGRRSGDELVSFFQACDLYVHTPKTVGWKFEGFGIVYLEAGACGKPVVATDAGGIRDAVIDGETGLIAEEGDIDGIADRIIRILDNPVLGKHLGEGGRAYARRHDWSRIAETFLALYRKALANHPGEKP